MKTEKYKKMQGKTKNKKYLQIAIYCISLSNIFFNK